MDFMIENMRMRLDYRYVLSSVSKEMQKPHSLQRSAFKFAIWSSEYSYVALDNNILMTP